MVLTVTVVPVFRTVDSVVGTAVVVALTVSVVLVELELVEEVVEAVVVVALD